MSRPGWALFAAAALLSGWMAPLAATDELPFYSVPGDRHFERTPSYVREDDHFAIAPAPIVRAIDRHRYAFPV